VLGIPLSLAVTVGAFLRQQARADEETRQAMERLEQEVRVRSEAERAARVADRAKSQFLATMSHELRTPMNGVVGMADLLSTTELTREQGEYAETLRRSAEAMMVLLDGLIDFTRFEEGALGLERRVFDLNAAIEGMARLQAVAADRKGIELVVDLDPTLPPMVHGDEARIRQMVLALLSNALKFTEQGHIVLRVEHEGARVRVAVEDTGIGMGSDVQARAFQPLALGDSSVTREHGGAGMGLANVAVLARAMGGEVGIHSAPGAGSLVWFTMDLDAAADPEAAPASPAPLSGLRVLVVDDDDATRAAVLRQLKALGADADVAPDGGAALQVLRRATATGAPVHVVLLDLEMPDMGGLELCLPLRSDIALASTARVLVVPPGRAVPAAVAARAGVMAQLDKPVLGGDLVAVLGAIAPDGARGVAGGARRAGG